MRGETPLIQAATGERSFTVETDAVTNLPMATRNFTEFINLVPGVDNGNRAGNSDSTGGGSNNFMMDGVGTMEPGSNRLMVSVNTESICAGEGAHVELPGRVRPVERPAGDGRHPQRHQSLPRIGLRRRAQLGLVLELQDQPPQRRSEDDAEAARLGLLGGRSGGQARRPEQAVLLFRPGVPAARAGQQRGSSPLPDRSRAARRLLARRRTTTATRGRSFAITGSPGSCSNADRTACYADGGVLGKIPADRLYQIGLNILNQYPMPNLTNIPAGQSYNFEITRPNQRITSYQPVVKLDYQAAQALRLSFKYASWGQPKVAVLGSLPGFNDTMMNEPVVPLWAVTANYSLTPTMFLEASIGHAQHDQAGCALNGGGANFCTAGFPVNDVASRANTGLAGLPYLFPDANVIDPGYYQFKALNQVNPAPWDGTRMLLPPNFGFGGQGHECAAQQQLSRVRRPLVGQRLRVQPDQAGRASHHQSGLLPSARAEAAESGRAVRDAELQQRHQQPARFTVPVFQRRTRHFSVVPASVEVHRGHLDLQQRRVLHPGQLEGHQPADVRLRHAVRPPAAAVRQHRTVG